TEGPAERGGTRADRDENARQGGIFTPAHPKGPRQVVEVEGESRGRHRHAEAPEKIIVTTAGTDRLAGTVGKEVEDRAGVISKPSNFTEVDPQDDPEAIGCRPIPEVVKSAECAARWRRSEEPIRF